MQKKFKNHYDRTGKPFAFIDGTILHLTRKVKQIKRTYEQIYVDQYEQQCQQRFQKFYSRKLVKTTMGRKLKADEANVSNNSFDEGFADELKMWLKTNRNKTVGNLIKQWS